MTGTQVAMYKDDPGIFYNMHGQQVSDNLAEAAGFDLVAMRHDTVRVAAMAEAMKRVDRQIAEAAAEVPIEHEIKRAGVFSLWDYGHQRFIVKMGDDMITPKPVTRMVADALMSKLASDAEAAPTV